MCLLLCGLLGGDGLVYSSICASFINKQLTADIHTRTQAHKARAHTPPGACLRTSLAQNNRQACTQNTHTHTTNCMRAQMHKYITNPPLHTCLRTEPWPKQQAGMHTKHAHTTNHMRAQMHNYITNPPLHTCLCTEPCPRQQADRHTKHTHTHHQPHACIGARIPHKPLITHMLVHRALPRTTGRHAHKTRTHTTNHMRAQVHEYLTNPALHTCLRTEPCPGQQARYWEDHDGAVG